MDDELRKQLCQFVQEQLGSAGVELETPLTDSTSLLQSGVLDSLAILHLASLIEKFISEPMDLATVNIAEEWDSIDQIMEFVSRHQNR